MKFEVTRWQTRRTMAAGRPLVWHLGISAGQHAESPSTLCLAFGSSRITPSFMSETYGSTSKVILRFLVFLNENQVTGGHLKPTPHTCHVLQAQAR